MVLSQNDQSESAKRDRLQAHYQRRLDSINAQMYSLQQERAEIINVINGVTK